MHRTIILKKDSTTEKRREEEAFVLASITHYCFVETKTNCGLIASETFKVEAELAPDVQFYNFGGQGLFGS